VWDCIMEQAKSPGSVFRGGPHKLVAERKRESLT
jgi:hypothetical protein